MSIKRVGIHWNSTKPTGYEVALRLIDTLERKGIKVCVWTVNDAASAWAALGRGVDIIMTDRPSSLLREMKEF